MGEVDQDAIRFMPTSKRSDWLCLTRPVWFFMTNDIDEGWRDDLDIPDSEFPAKAEEMCSEGKDGKLTDQHFHDEMEDPDIDEQQVEAARKRAKADGVSQAVIDELYPPVDRLQVTVTRKSDQDDGYHNEILDDKTAHEAIQLAAIQQCMDEGYTEDEAWELYGNSIPHLREEFKAMAKESAKTRFEQIANEPGIGMGADGKLNITGFDKNYAPGGPKDPNKGKK